jgi:hypothetical protein
MFAMWLAGDKRRGVSQLQQAGEERRVWDWISRIPFGSMIGVRGLKRLGYRGTYVFREKLMDSMYGVQPLLRYISTMNHFASGSKRCKVSPCPISADYSGRRGISYPDSE